MKNITEHIRVGDILVYQPKRHTSRYKVIGIDPDTHVILRGVTEEGVFSGNDFTHPYSELNKDFKILPRKEEMLSKIVPFILLNMISSAKLHEELHSLIVELEI